MTEQDEIKALRKQVSELQDYIENDLSRNNSMKLKQINYHFHKAQFDHKWLDDFISIHTWNLALLSLRWGDLKYNYDHVEIEFVDRYLCFSSTLRNKGEGVRFAPSKEILKNPSRWETIVTWVKPEIEKKLFQAAQGEVGKKYDKWGILTGFFLLAPYLQNDIERYCSDIIGWLAWIGKILKKRYWIVSPRRLAGLMAKALKTKPIPYTLI